MTKSEFLALVRANLNEATADLWTDADIYKFSDQVLRTLPSKNIYNEEIWKLNTVADQDEYQLPTGTYKVERVLFDDAYPSTPPDWVKQNGWETYAGRLILDLPPEDVRPMRIFLRKNFVLLSTLANGDTINMGEDQLEVFVIGTILKCYGAIMAYFLDQKNWDYNAKPDGISMNQVNNWIRDLKQDYNDAIRMAKKTPAPREIDLTA